MYCPKCSDDLVSVEGELTCVRGEMSLSKSIEKSLFDYFIVNVNAPPEKEYDVRWGGNWYCPGCGIKMVEEEKGAVRCPQCKKNLGSFIYRLVEIHPHN